MPMAQWIDRQGNRMDEQKRGNALISIALSFVMGSTTTMYCEHLFSFFFSGRRGDGVVVYIPMNYATFGKCEHTRLGLYCTRNRLFGQSALSHHVRRCPVVCVCASKGLERHPPSFSFVFTRLDDVNDADATDVFCTHPIFLTLHVLT